MRPAGEGRASSAASVAVLPLLRPFSPAVLSLQPAAGGGDGRGGHTPAPLVRRRAREVGRQGYRRPRVVSIHCTVERAEWDDHTQGARDQCVAGRTGRLRRQRSRAAAAVQRVAATQTHPHGSKAALRRDACGCDAVPATLKQRRRCGDSKLGKLV